MGKQAPSRNFTLYCRGHGPEGVGLDVLRPCPAMVGPMERRGEGWVLIFTPVTLSSLGLSFCIRRARGWAVTSEGDKEKLIAYRHSAHRHTAAAVHQAPAAPLATPLHIHCCTRLHTVPRGRERFLSSISEMRKVQLTEAACTE